MKKINIELGDQSIEYHWYLGSCQENVIGSW